MPNSHSLRRMVCTALVTAPLVVAGCGARGPLDVVVVEEPLDSGAGAPSFDAPAEAPSIDAPRGAPGPGLPGFDAGGLLSCGTCLQQHCGTQLLMCIQSSTCLSTAQCVLSNCLSGGMPDPICVTQKCADGGFQSFGDLIQVFTCIGTNCPGCTSALGGLGGLGGGGGGSSGSGG